MDEVINVISKCITQLNLFVDGPAAHLSGTAAPTTIETIRKCIADHAYLFTDHRINGQRMWELVCSATFTVGEPRTPTTAATATATLLSLFRRLTDSVAASARAPEADILKHLVKLLRDAVKPPLVRGASPGQLRCLFQAAMRLLKLLLPLKKRADVQTECLHLLLALMQLSDLQEAHCAVVASGDEVAQVAKLCADICGAKHDVALRPQNASMQLLGCLCEQPAYVHALSGQLAERILKCFLDVARNLAQRAEVNQTLGEGLLRGLAGVLGSFPLRCEEDAPALTLINNIVLSALMLGETSTNYTFCLSALFLLRRRASDTLAPFTLLCAAEYSVALRSLWMHRNKDVRRETHAAAAVFWSALSSQLQQRCSSEVADANTTRNTAASHKLHSIVEFLLRSLDSSADREASYALEALYHLLPAVAALSGPQALQTMSTRLEERVGGLLITASAQRTEALFQQVPYLLATLGQLLTLLPSVSPRQQAVVRELLDWVLLLYPHPKFYNREKTVPGIVLVIRALTHHPRAPHNTLPRLLSERTLELVGEAPGAAMMRLAGERISTEERLDRMATLWTRLLTTREESGAEAEAESKQRLSAAFYRACTGFCERARLEVVIVKSNSEATLERILVDGVDGVQPSFPTHYSAFLSFVDFFVRLSEGLKGSGCVCRPPAEELTAWLEALVRGASAALHVSGFYTLLHHTVVGVEGVCPHSLTHQRPYTDAPLASGNSDVTSDGHHENHLCVSPLLHHFLSTECLRRVHVYSDELLYQCAMCVVVGAALVGSEDRGELAGSRARACDDHRRLDAYVRAFKVVMTATPTSLQAESVAGSTNEVVCSFGSSPAILESNRQHALRVLEKKACRSPRWAAAVLPALTSALRSAEVVAAVRAPVQMLAARHGVAIAAELQHHSNEATFALLCRGEPASNGRRDSMPRWLATMQPVTVPLVPVDSALHIGYLVPLVSRLSLHGKHPAVRTAAAEVLYWCVVWAIGKKVNDWGSAVFPPLLSLASLARTSTGGSGGGGGSMVHQELHGLLMQAARWFGRSAGTPEEAELFVSVLLRGLGEREGTQRQVATEALFAYAIPPADEPQTVTPHFRAVIGRLVRMECGVSEWSRLGAAHCLHVMMRRLCKVRVPGLVCTVQAVAQGAVGCLRRCTEAPIWGAMETATCNEVQESLRWLGAYCHDIRQLENEEEQREADRFAADLVHAARAVLPALARRHTVCAITLLQTLPAVTHTNASARQVLLLSQELICEQQQRLGPAAVRSLDSTVGGCATLVALLQSGYGTETNKRAIAEAVTPVICTRADDCCVETELLRLLTVVLQAIVEEARVATHESRCISPHIVRWLLELVDVVPEQTHATHFSLLLTPTVIAQAARVMVAGAKVTVENCAGDVGEDATAGVPLRRCAPSSQLAPTARWCLELIELLMRVAGQRRRGAQVIEDVLCAIRETSVFTVFTAASPARQLIDALSVGPSALVTGPVALAAALCQMEAPCSSGTTTLWMRIADSMKISPKTVVAMLLGLLRNSAALNATGGEEVCEGLLVLMLSEPDPALLRQHLRDLLASDAVQHNIFTSSSFAVNLEDGHGAVAVSPSSRSTSVLLSRAFDSVMNRCWQQASAALPTDRLVSALPSLTTVAMSEDALRSSSEAVSLFSLVGDWLAELQRRSLTSEHDKVLCRVCANLVAAEREMRQSTPTAAQDDGRGGARLAALLMLVQLIGPAIRTDTTLSSALCDLVLFVSKPANMCSLLASVDATEHVVWGFHVLAATMTPRPARRSLAVFPVDLRAVEMAFDFLNEVLNSALPLRWTELKTPREKTNVADVVRSGTALFAAVLPHKVQVLEVIAPLLAQESMPQRDTIVRQVHGALQALSVCQQALQLDACRCASRLLRDPRTHPGICDALTEHVLLPLLQASAEAVRLRLFEEEVRNWVTEAGRAPALGCFYMQTAAFSCLALMHRLCPLTELRGSISTAFTGRNPNTTGVELTLEVLKACRAAWQSPNTGGDDNSAEEADGDVGDSARADAPRRYRQAAFRCLLATLSQTQQTEKVFCRCFFQERSVAGWNGLFLVKRPGVAVTDLLDAVGEVQLWRDMDRCQVPELFAHLLRHFPSSSVTPGEPPEWVRHVVAVLRQPQLRLPVRMVFYEMICRHERFFGTFARCIFDGVADAVAAMAPSERAGKVIWELLALLTRWHREGSSRALAVGSAASLKALARYAAVHLAWEHSFTACEGSRALDPTSHKRLAELLEQFRRAQGAALASLSTSQPLTAAEMKMLLSHPAYERHAALEVIYLITNACGCLGCTGDSREVVEVYDLLGAFLGASASPQLYHITARLVGLEHRLLSEAATREPSSAVRKLLRDALRGTVCAILAVCKSDKKFLEVLEAMQEDRSGDLVYQLLSRTDLLRRYSIRKDSEKLLTLRVLARAGTYVADNYDSIHVCLSGLLRGGQGEPLLGICTVVKNALPHMSMESVRHVLRDLCCLDVLQAMESAEPARIAFYKMGLAALRRWTVVREDQEKQDGGGSVSADAEAFLVRRGLRDASPAVQGAVLEYLDVHAQHVPDTMWGRLTCLFTAEDGASGDGHSGSGGWVRHVALLLLSLSKRSRDFANPTYFCPEALHSEGASPTLATSADTAAESSVAQRQPRSAPLFSEAVQCGSPAEAATANAACPITAALAQIYAPPALVPQPPHQQQQPLSGARRPRATGAWRLGAAPCAAATAVTRSWLRLESGDSEQENAVISAGVMASRQISATMQRNAAHGAALQAGRSVMNAPSAAPSLESNTAGRLSEVRLTLQSLLVPLQVLCLHEDEVAARVLIDLISNAAVASPVTSESPHIVSLCSALTSLLPKFQSGVTTRQCELAKNPFTLFVALELLLHAQAAGWSSLASLDCAALVRLTSDVQAYGGSVPTAFLPVVDGTAHVVEKLLSSLQPSAARGVPTRPSLEFPALGWHAYHVAQRLRRHDDAACQAALQLFRATRRHEAPVIQLQGALDAMEVGGAAYSMRVIAKLLEDEEKEAAAAVATVASPATHVSGGAFALFAAREEVLRHYRSRASRLLLDWCGAASALQSATPVGAGGSGEVSVEGVRLRLRAQLQLMCDGAASAVTAEASTASRHRTGFEWGACLMANGRWLDCQLHAETSVDHLLGSTASHYDSGGSSLVCGYLAANSLSQLADAAQVLRFVSTSAASSAGVALQTYLDTMPASVPLSGAYGSLFIDDVLLIRRLIIDYHVQSTGDLLGSLQLTDNERHKLVAQIHELLGTWTVQQCSELLLLPEKTSAIETIASKADHATLSEPTRCALELLKKRSSLFRIAVTPREASGASREEALAAFQKATGKDVQQRAAAGLLSPAAARQWAADVAQCEVEIFASIGSILSIPAGSAASVQKREIWVSTLKENLRDTIPSHVALLNALEKLLPPVSRGDGTLADMGGDAKDAARASYITAATQSLWQLYANTFLWCAQAVGDRSMQVGSGGHLPVSARVPRLLSLFALPRVAEAAAQAQWRGTWEALVMLPTLVWLPWATLLVNALLQTEHAVLARILLRLCRERGQVLYYPINCAWRSLADLGKRRNAGRAVDDDLTRELAELHKWHRSHRMALVAEFAAALDELVEPQHRLEVRLSEVESLVKQHEQCTRGGGGAQAEYLMAALQLYERCKSDLMDPARWGRAQLYHRRAAQVLQELDRRNAFSAEVLKSGEQFRSAKREALRQVAQTLSTLSTSASNSATRSQELRLYSERLQHALGRSATAATTTTTQLGYTSDAAEPILQPVQPTHLLHTPPDAAQQCCTLVGVADRVLVLKSKRLPKKVDIYTSAGICTYMVKGGEDLRLDQRIQEVFTFANLCLLVSPRSRLSALTIRTYAVVPVSPLVGLICWVPRTTPLQELMKEATPPDAHDAVARFCRARGKPQEILPLYKTAHITGIPEQEYKDLVYCLRQSALVESLQSIATDHCSWLGARDAFLDTNAAASMASFVLGVGDRHAGNLLVDLLNCELVAIGFGLAFGDATRKLPVLELMPFRHTPQLQRVQGVLGDDVTRCRMRHVLHVLRAERQVVEGMVAALLMPDADAMGDEESRIAGHQLDVVRRKLNLEHPAGIILRDVARNAYVTQDKDVWIGVKACLCERKRDENGEDADLTETALSTLHQEDVFVQRLLRIASDPRVLGRAYAGWQAYM
ncbi:NUC194 domain/Phosphatidylinositol 3- and 4-kinase, putative [Leishmania donovani]|uniref:non-specific serine/threonine protein kinase n=1 Tax=Leishmania donovani TaxID=5661 RepID=A0A3S7XB35_LEIDO|nr:NUC194 domain/Phosphatidylinositol 3- and 4-kinase, putative [Leishmania donovani]